jgi:hypothetical protein
MEPTWRYRLLAVCLLPVLAAGVPVQAQQPGPWLSAAAIQLALVDRPVLGLYADGRSWSERMSPDGRTVLTEASEQFTGTWAVNERQELCFAYHDHPNYGDCFRYIRLSANCFEHFFRVPAGGGAGEDPADSWLTNGRLWRDDEPTTCELKPAV